MRRLFHMSGKLGMAPYPATAGTAPPLPALLSTCLAPASNQYRRAASALQSTRQRRQHGRWHIEHALLICVDL